MSCDFESLDIQKEFWRGSEMILKNVMIYSSKGKTHEDIAEGDDDNGGFAVMLNVKNKKFIAADWGKYKAVLVSKRGHASHITGKNDLLATISGS